MDTLRDNASLQDFRDTAHGNEAAGSLDLSKLPEEIKVSILRHILMTQAPCLDSLFWTCHKFQECGYHSNWNEPFITTPDPKISALGPYFLHESHKAFFSNHTFVFATRMQEYHRLDSGLNLLQGLGFPSAHTYRFRDVAAARLLDFIDRPEWRGKGTSFQVYDESYDHVDAYRHRIQHLIFLSSDTRTSTLPADMLDWDWPLKVDWTTLPHLKTLVLDLRIYSLAPQLGPEAEIEYDRMIEEGAKRMEVLSLKSLVIYGLCGDEEKKERMKEMFSAALAKEGELLLYGFEDTVEEIEGFEAGGWNVLGDIPQEVETEW